MPATASSSAAGAPRKRRGVQSCVRCQKRKIKCVPHSGGGPSCSTCVNSGSDCIFSEKTPHEIFLLEYVSQLERRIAVLESELALQDPEKKLTTDYLQAQHAAVDNLELQFPQGPWVPGRSPTSVDKGKAVQKEEPSDPEIKQEEDDLAAGIGLLSLHGSAEPLYVGESSGISWARVCATALRRDRSTTSALSRFAFLSPPSTATTASALSYSFHHPSPQLPPPALRQHYLHTAYMHIQARYCCVDWPTIYRWHEKAEEICLRRPTWGAGTGSDKKRQLAAFTLWLCYGFGARLTERQKLEGAVSHEVYYNSAVACLSTVTSHHSLGTVQALLLLAIYSFRHPRAELSVWQVAGLALRTAIELGLHRRIRSKAGRESDSFKYEMRKRVWWTVYTLDRMIAVQLGRPVGIHDRDIDIEFPLNLDVEFDNVETIKTLQRIQALNAAAAMKPGDEYAGGYEAVTSMTSFIHNVRLNQLKTSIEEIIFRLDYTTVTRPKPTAHEVDKVLGDLLAWKNAHPMIPPGTQRHVPMLSKEHLDMEYYNCVQVLLRPLTSITDPEIRYVVACAEAAAALCEIQYQLLHPLPALPNVSTWALYRLFLSGLTLLHLSSAHQHAFIQPPLDRNRIRQALHQCSASLEFYASNFERARGYESCFTELLAVHEERLGSGVAPSLDVMSHAIQPLMNHTAQTPDAMQVTGNQGFSPGQGLEFDWTALINGVGAGSQVTPLMGLQEQLAAAESMTQLGQQPVLGQNSISQGDWHGRLGEVGGIIGGGSRDDFLALMSSFGLDSVMHNLADSVPMNITEQGAWTMETFEEAEAAATAANAAARESAQVQQDKEDEWKYPFA